MTNKFEIGSVWKTRGGWRAVVVDKDAVFMTVWHKKSGGDLVLHYMNGMIQSNCPGDIDLIEPWVEPKVHDVWINIYPDDRSVGCDPSAFFYKTKEAANRDCTSKRIACVNVKFKEGEGL